MRSLLDERHPKIVSVRRWLRCVRDLCRSAIDRPLYRIRNRRALSRLARMTPARVLFVCTGNICRSPYAERVWENLTGGAVAADSAGFIGPGRPPPPKALAAATARRIDHAHHRSKLVTPEIVRFADVVFVFDGANFARLGREHGREVGAVFWLGDFDPVWAGERAIRDPWGRDVVEFRKTFSRIERCIASALGALGVPSRLGPSTAQQPSSSVVASNHPCTNGDRTVTHP